MNREPFSRTFAGCLLLLYQILQIRARTGRRWEQRHIDGRQLQSNHRLRLLQSLRTTPSTT